MHSGDVKSCTHCFSVGFYFSFVAGASKVCHSRRHEFEPRPPLAVFVLHLAELTRAPILPSRSRCTWPSLAGRRKALWSPENSSKENSEPKGKSMTSAPHRLWRPVSCCRHASACVSPCFFDLSADSALRFVSSFIAGCCVVFFLFCVLVLVSFQTLMPLLNVFCRLPPSIVSCRREYPL